MKPWIKGMDISSLPEVEACGGRFFCDGKPMDALQILQEHGMNLVRLRLWNDPRSPLGEPYGGGDTDFETVRGMARRLRALELPWLLDFHYSDCWADPGKQIPPNAWQGLGPEELEGRVYEYTKSVLLALKEEDLLPAMAAPGNELTNGLLWPVGKEFPVTARLVSAGIRAIRETAPDCEVMLHLDNGGNSGLYRRWFDAWFTEGGEDFDIIGLSYYPFWHGTLEDLEENMRMLAGRYGKRMIVAETSTAFTMEDYQAYEKLPAERRKGMAVKPELAAKVPFSMTPEGQAAFMERLMEVIDRVPGGLGQGFIYWEPACLPVPGLEWATEAGIAYMREKGPGGNEWANQALFDYEGNALPALKTIQDFRPGFHR